MQLEEIVSKVAKSIDYKKLEEALAKEIENTILDTIKSELRSYSDFGKVLREKISESVGFNVKALTLPEFYKDVHLIVQNGIKAIENKQLKEIIEKDMEALLTPIKKEWKLSEIVEKVRDTFENYDHNEYFTFILDEAESSDGYYRVYIDEDHGVDKYRCSIQFAVSKQGEIYSMEVDSKKIDTFLRVGKYGAEAFLYKLYAQKVIITKDEDYIDECYPDCND